MGFRGPTIISYPTVFCLLRALSRAVGRRLVRPDMAFNVTRHMSRRARRRCLTRACCHSASYARPRPSLLTQREDGRVAHTTVWCVGMPRSRRALCGFRHEHRVHKTARSPSCARGCPLGDEKAGPLCPGERKGHQATDRTSGGGCVPRTMRFHSLNPLGVCVCVFATVLAWGCNSPVGFACKCRRRHASFFAALVAPVQRQSRSRWLSAAAHPEVASPEFPELSSTSSVGAPVDVGGKAVAIMLRNGQAVEKLSKEIIVGRLRVGLRDALYRCRSRCRFACKYVCTCACRCLCMCLCVYVRLCECAHVCACVCLCV